MNQPTESDLKAAKLKSIIQHLKLNGYGWISEFDLVKIVLFAQSESVERDKLEQFRAKVKFAITWLDKLPPCTAKDILIETIDDTRQPK